MGKIEKNLMGILKCKVPLFRSLVALDTKATPSVIANAICDKDISVRKCAILNPLMRDPVFFLAVELRLKRKRDKRHLNFLRRMTRKIK